ncbi:TonB-dependent receptor plug domain-containing protein [Desulfospira joergensenii]|uniref:TonB-dependent receptor plug domain-containing protein n=1 Tax=Desulfospira joergensenii TaxID=53329 RepID=UPI001378FF5C|nr:TonB-dependent receptor [Desulfospira joergensenii]
MKRTNLKWMGLLIVLLLSTTGFARDLPSEESYEMDTVVVTANRTKERLRDVSQNITIFTEKEIRQSGAVSVTDLLKKAGIQVYSDGGASYGNEGVVIRGGRSSMHGFDIAGDILVLVDGHRTGSDFLGNIGLENAERIEVIRGPGAVQYGASAMGGVINVITKRGKEKPEGFIEVGFGSWGEERYKAGASGKKGKLDFAVSAAYSSRDDYELGNGEDFENSDVEDRIRYNFNTGWNFNDTNRLGLTVQGTDTNDAGKGEDEARTYYYYTRQDRDNHSIDLSYEGGSESGSTTWLTRYFQGEVNYDLKRFTSSSTTQVPLSENANQFRGSQAQVSHDFGLFRTIAGMDWMSYEFDQRQDGEAASAARQNTARSDFDNIGGFLLGEVHLLEKENLTLSAGIRYDDFDVSVNARKIREDVTVSRDIEKDSWNPSFGIAFSPIDILKLRANYARAFKMPLPRQMTGYTIMKTTPFVGNPDLEPEKSDNYDLGFDLDWKSWFVSATWFYSDYQDMIGYETHSSADEHYNAKHYWYYNVDSAEIQGIELGVKFDLARTLGYTFQLEPYINWTHLLVFEDGNGWKLPDRSRDSIGTGLVFGSQEVGLTLSLDATYYGTQFTVDRETGSSTVESQEKLADVGDAWVLDLSCTQRLFKLERHGEVRVKASIHNLFDEYYSTNEDNWMPGRSFYLGLEYRL